MVEVGRLGRWSLDNLGFLSLVPLGNCLHELPGHGFFGVEEVFWYEDSCSEGQVVWVYF